MIILSDTIFYISGERNDLSQCPNLTLHSDILRISWPYIFFGFIPASLARTQQTYFTHIGTEESGTKMCQSTHQTNLETHLQTMDPPQQIQARGRSVGLTHQGTDN